MGKIAFVFAGQGAQYPGMGQELAQCSPAAAEIFAKLDALRPGTSAQCFGGTDEELKETKNTQPCMFAVELAAALKEACDHLPEHTAKVSALRDKLIAGLEAIPHGALNGDRNHRLPGNVSFCFEGIEGESMLLLLDDRGICASSGSACTSGSLDPSHVLLAIGRPHEVSHGSLRLSLCEENTEQEVDVMLREIPQVIDYLRNMSPVWRKLQKGECSYVIQ